MLQNIKDKDIVNGGIIFSVIVAIAIGLLGTWLTRFELAPVPPGDSGFFYEWQLANPTFWSRVTAWFGWIFHNLAIFWTIWYARKNYSKYSDQLRTINWIALGINAVFIVLHYIQTAVFYDGIAQDVPSWTAQFAVAFMLIVVLIMDSPRRGLFFGRKIKFRRAFLDFFRHYHGYIFSFAVIYTFWFHPMVPTWGHLVGFVHVILVMLQGSLMYMRVHLNRKWMFLLEILVLPHAFQVALAQGKDLWPMFLYGFATIFLVTQMHGLGLKTWVKRAFYTGFIITVVLTYTLLREPYQANEVIRIPFIEYGVIFFMYGIYLLGAKLAGRSERLKEQTA